jgi:hypothetical protein
MVCLEEVKMEPGSQIAHVYDSATGRKSSWRVSSLWAAAQHLPVKKVLVEDLLPQVKPQTWITDVGFTMAEPLMEYVQMFGKSSFKEDFYRNAFELVNSVGDILNTFEEDNKTGRSLMLLMQHAKRVHESDLGWPILLDPRGRILDGRHRVAKAFYEGKATIKAQSFEIYPLKAD